MKISHTFWFQKIMEFFYLPNISRILLRCLSFKRKYQNIIYRIRAVETFFLAKDILHSSIYDSVLQKAKIETFIDLGCNTGLFSCLLANHYGKFIRGIMVDADPDMVTEAKWHIDQNNMINCCVKWGLVGPSCQTQAHFFVNNLNLCSSNKSSEQNPFHFKTRKILDVPVIDLAELMEKHFSDCRVHLLKIDIEGSEIDLLANRSLNYLKKVDWIIIESHDWIMSLEQIMAHLHPIFSFVQLLDHDGQCRLGLFKNSVDME